MGFGKPSGTKSVKVDVLAKSYRGYKIYKDGREYAITSILHDASGKRYLIEGEGGYFASVPEGRSLTIKK